MRAGIGLVGILLGVGLMVYLFAQSELPKIKEGERIKDEARQYSGRSQDDTPATESFATEPQMKGSKLAALQVTSVTPGGAMDTYYGLRTGDEIVAIGDSPVDTLSNSDDQMAKAMVVQEGYQKKAKLTVRRAGQHLDLPLPVAAAAVAAGAPKSPAPASPDAPAAPAPARRGIQGQLQDIQNAAGGGQDK